MNTHPNAPRRGGSSYWGTIQDVTPYGPDAVSVSTASHGGFWVSPEGLAKIPAKYHATPYSPGAWFEEDCDWCIPYLALGLDRYEPTPERGAEVKACALRTFAAFHNADPVILFALAAA